MGQGSLLLALLYHCMNFDSDGASAFVQFIMDSALTILENSSQCKSPLVLNQLSQNVESQEALSLPTMLAPTGALYVQMCHSSINWSSLAADFFKKTLVPTPLCH